MGAYAGATACSKAQYIYLHKLKSMKEKNDSWLENTDSVKLIRYLIHVRSYIC